MGSVVGSEKSWQEDQCVVRDFVVKSRFLSKIERHCRWGVPNVDCADEGVTKDAPQNTN